MHSSAVLRAPSAEGRKSKGKSHPPHSMSSGAVDGLRRCKRQYPKKLRQTHPLLKCVSSGAVDTGPISHPPYSGQRANGWNKSMQMPIFQGVLNVYPLANLLPKGPTDDLPGIRPKAVCGDVQCNPPSAISHVWRRGGVACIICYTGCVFWPSANCLPWRKGSATSRTDWQLAIRPSPASQLESLAGYWSPPVF
jgi:hypothetical protein